MELRIDNEHEIKTVFVLKAYFIEPEIVGKYDNEKGDTRHYLAPTYPEYNLKEIEIGIYSSWENTKGGILCYIEEIKHISQYQNPDDEKNNDIIQIGDLDKLLYCFMVEEIRLNLPSPYCFENTETLRSYLPDGSLYAENLTSWIIQKDIIGTITREGMERQGAFVGRESEEIRFHHGDIVEFIHKNKMMIGIVIRTPAHIEEIFPNIQYGKHYKHMNDFSDDIYRVLAGDEVYNFKKGGDTEKLYDYNVFPVEIFLPRFPVPEKLKGSMRVAYLSWCFHSSEK